jgi:pimeloyl-ACP methyl ester carboxylesterase
MLSSLLILTFLGVTQTVLPCAQTGSIIPDDRTVDVFGVRLHYLDWGGTGDALLFLPPSCETAHIFGDIAPAFTDRFRVLGLTTRGCAQSGPADAYDLDAQLREVDEFLSALQLEHATLAGFSAGGGKVIRFARLYPSRVTKLVVLDSVYSDVPPELEQRMDAAIAKLLGDRDDDSTDWNQRYFQAWELGAWSAAMDRNMQATSPASVSPAWWAAFRADMEAGHYFETEIAHRTLMFFATDLDQERIKQFDESTRVDLMPLAQEADRRRRTQIAEFRRNGPHVQIVEMPATAHYCFVHRPEEVIREMRRFLVEQ